MRQIILLIALTLNHLNSNGQTYSDIISDSEIISFLTWEIKLSEEFSEISSPSSNKRIYYKISSWDTLNFVMPDTLDEENILLNFMYLYREENQLDSIFSKEDKKFLFRQFINIKDTLWKHEFTNSMVENKGKNRYHYSLPLFSRDKKHVVVKRVYYCGSLCAQGGYFVYRRLEKGSWELITVVNRWES